MSVLWPVACNLVQGTKCTPHLLEIRQLRGPLVRKWPKADMRTPARMSALGE
jgi:hypothetical protein